MAGGASGMMMRDNVKDKYLGDSDDDEDGGSDAEENVIEASDMVILGARTDEDASILEVNCYDPSTGNLWVHHDITLAAFPLCMAYLDMPPSTRFDGGSAGAYVAVGTFKPAIEIWNLDVIDPLEPVATLGGENLSAASAVLKEQEEEQAGGVGNKKGSKDKKKKKNKAKVKKAMAAVTLVDGSHTDAVMGLAWNPLQRQVLASASADTTVKLWDVTTQQCSVTLSNHQDKVGVGRDWMRRGEGCVGL
jgi:periodic tryptophan protein 1